MAGTLDLRRYEPSDADRVWTIHEEALRASSIEFVEGAPADEDIRTIEERYLGAGGEFLVGEADGTVVAMGGFRPRDDAVEVRRMRVHPDYQRRGYAAALLDRLEALARERGADRAVLNTHEDLAAARRLYESKGYREVRREPQPAADHERIYYRKDL